MGLGLRAEPPLTSDSERQLLRPWREPWGPQPSSPDLRPRATLSVSGSWDRGPAQPCWNLRQRGTSPRLLLSFLEILHFCLSWGFFAQHLIFYSTHSCVGCLDLWVYRHPCFLCSGQEPRGLARLPGGQVSLRSWGFTAKTFPKGKMVGESNKGLITLYFLT